MPRPLTEIEKSTIMDIMYNKGIQLIRLKKLKSITVEDVTSASGIAKGTFYAYYKSKEEFLYEIINRFEIELMDQVAAVARGSGDLKSKVLFIFKNIYLASNSIAFSLQPQDVKWLLSKLPQKVNPHDQKTQNNFVTLFAVLGIPTAKCTSSTIHYLADCLLHISSSQLSFCDEDGRQETMNLLINTIADYVCTLAVE